MKALQAQSPRDELLTPTIKRIPAPDTAAAAATQALFDAKTKPRGSLGRLEGLACTIAATRGRPPESVRPAIVLAAADHGVATEGVSAYPQEVTGQMVATYLAGGAAINVLARRAGAEVVVVDAGIAEPSPDGVRSLRAGPGTANFLVGPAMTRRQATQLLSSGIELAGTLAHDGYTLIGLGEMGIGNTTSASAITAAVLELDPALVCGRGTGLDETGLARKVDVVGRALELHRPSPDDPIGILASVGGFEIAVLAGVALGAAARRVPVVLDGFITGAAALLASRLAPALNDHLIAAHRSPEPGHPHVLQALGLEPLLDLELRLGEGTGAALGITLVQAAVDVLSGMATFESAGVTDAGR
jgi:nicotinate-nucleotide--dimethylbenzimidazole phosphoribosyltransferase